MLTKKTLTTIVSIVALVGVCFLISHPGRIYVNRVLGMVISPRAAELLQTPGVSEASVIRTASGFITSFFHASKTEEINSAAIIDYTNRERIAAGITPLSINATLTATATGKLEDMALHHYFEHVSPDGKSVSDLGDEAGYAYVLMGENLALGNFANANDVVTAWMESSGHRKNILNAQYQEIGIAAAKKLYGGQKVWIIVQHFGTPRDACPAIEYNLKIKINSLNARLSKQQMQISLRRTAILAADDTEDGVPTEEYKEMVKTFNSLVQEYNRLLGSVRTLTVTYNQQVMAFNNCIAAFQTEE